jgi:hypothetical protein
MPAAAGILLAVGGGIASVALGLALIVAACQAGKWLWHTYRKHTPAAPSSVETAHFAQAQN